MSVLIYAESSDGKFKKNTFEAVAYGKKVAELLETSTIAMAINSEEPQLLSKYGADKILNIKNVEFSVKNNSHIIQQIIEKESIQVVVFESTPNSLYVAPMVAAKADASFVSNVISLPSSAESFTVKRNVFSNKAFVNATLTKPIKIVAIAKNSYEFAENPVSENIEDFSPETVESSVKQKSVEKSSGKITIADADVVVSGGRGLKGPENWGMIEDLAEVLGAATACSKPVSDLGWRPHSEHVGQTGKPVASNLYIAIGISGAIQHLAGVNSSKVKVVINTDAEAPFFKSADYGMVADAFEVVPELVQKLKG